MSRHKRLAKVNSNSKSREKIQLSKWREQTCFWRQNSNYHSKCREQACFSSWRRSATPTACATSAEMALGLRQTSHSAGHWRFLPPFFFCGCWCNFFSTPPTFIHKISPFQNEAQERPSAVDGLDDRCQVFIHKISPFQNRGLRFWSQASPAMQCHHIHAFDGILLQKCCHYDFYMGSL